MKKYSLLILVYLYSILFITPSIIKGQEVAPGATKNSVEILPYLRGQTQPFFGHEHAYTVTFRGNGEATVVLKAAFTNNAEATTSAIFFKTSKVEPKDLVAYQVIREGQCILYKPDTQATIQSSIPDCESYDDPNYFEPYYYGNVSYKKATTTIDGETIRVDLPQSISPEKSGSLILFYNSPGYTTKTLFGGYTFTFETLKVDAPIRSLQVGVNTDTDLNIKGVSSEVQYRNIFSPKIAVQEFSKGYSTDSSSQYFAQIGTGRLLKNAYELQPNETFTVEGMYGSSWWNLYATELIITIISLIVVGVLVVIIFRKAYKRIQNTLKAESSEESIPKNKQNTLLLLGLSFISSFLIGGYSVFQFFVIMLIQKQYYDSTITLFIGLVLFIISIAVYALLFVGPSLFVGLKKGTIWGVGTFVATLCWLFIYVMIFLLFAVYLRTMFSGGFNMPIPMSTPAMQTIEKAIPAVQEVTIDK